MVASAEELQAAATSGDDDAVPAPSFAPLASVPLPSPAKPRVVAAPPVTIFSAPVLPPRPAPNPVIAPRAAAPELAAVPALAKVVALPPPSAHPATIPAPAHAPAPIPAPAPAPRVIEMTAMLPPAHEPAAAAVRAAREIIDPALLAAPSETSAAWEIDDEESADPAPSGEIELTDLVPRRGRSIGIGLAIGAISALVACLVFLFIVRPTPRRASAPTAAPAAITTPITPDRDHPDRPARARAGAGSRPHPLSAPSRTSCRRPTGRRPRARGS